MINDYDSVANVRLKNETSKLFDRFFQKGIIKILNSATL